MRKQKLSVNLEPEVIDGLRRRADANRRCLSAELTVLIEPALGIQPPAQSESPSQVRAD